MTRYGQVNGFQRPGRTYSLTFYPRNGDYIALIGAGTYHNLDGDSMKVAFSLNCSVVEVEHSYNNIC